jgi:macrolide transport system ATP-binding/permease protein
MLMGLRFSVRILCKHWRLASIAVFSLAIALAVAVMGLSVINAILLRVPGVSEPPRILTVTGDTPRDLNQGFCYPDYQFYRDHNHVFSAVAAFPESISFRHVSIGQRDESVLVNAVSDNFFSVLGVKPYLGRFFFRGDDDTRTFNAVLSYDFWRKLGANPGILGTAVMLNSGSQPLTVIGIAPKGFTGVLFSDATAVWYPFSGGRAVDQNADDSWRTNREETQFALYARLKPGVSAAAAAAEMRVLSSQLAQQFPADDKDRVAKVHPLSMLPPDTVYGGKIFSAILLAVIALVLFAACSNVSSLLIALANIRRHELLIRAALGATRWRLLRQLLLDSLLVAAAGGVFGFLLTWWGVTNLSHYEPYLPGFGKVPIVLDFHPDLTVLGLTMFVVFGVALAAGIAPALYASTPAIAGALSGEIVVGGTRKHRLRAVLVAIQIAVCTLVLVGVGLCVRSLAAMHAVNLGFSARNLGTVNLSLPPSTYPPERGRELYDRIRQSLSQIYGVESVSIGSAFPLQSGDGNRQQIELLNAPAGSPQKVEALEGIVDGNYFSTIGVPLLAGRTFSDVDQPKAPPVSVVNHIMAEKFWPGEDPIGKKFRIVVDQPAVNGKVAEPMIATVIGVVGDVKETDLDQPNRPFIYYALSQNYQEGFYIIIRTRAKPAQWSEPVTSAIAKLDPQLSPQFLTLDEWIAFSLYFSWVVLVCASVVGFLAAVLAVVGLYGAVFYSVSERRREFGIRVALGAQRVDLLTMILRQTGVITAVGVVAGLGAGIAATAFVRTQLFGIRPVEWVVLFGAAFAIAAMTALSAYSAARPWLRVDPMESLRHV